jgi:hypothetical protein
VVTEHPSTPLRARVIGAGAVVTLEDPENGARSRMRILSRSGRIVEVEPLPGSGVLPHLRDRASLVLRAARPSGLFCFQAMVEGTSTDGRGVLRLSDAPPRRRQLRGYFRMPVRFGVLLEVPSGEQTAPMLRARNLSGSGILLLDPDCHLVRAARARVGIPLGPSGEIVRLPARVVRVQEGPRRVALVFEEISEASRILLLRYLFREHRRRRKLGLTEMGYLAPVTPIERP